MSTTTEALEALAALEAMPANRASAEMKADVVRAEIERLQAKLERADDLPSIWEARAREVGFCESALNDVAAELREALSRGEEGT